MSRPSPFSSYRSLVLVVLAASLSASHAMAEDVLGEPAMASSQNPADLTVGTENPENLTVGTEDPASLQGYSHPLPAPTSTENPAALTAATVSPSSLEATPFSLQSLPNAAAQEQEVRERVAREVSDASPPPRVATSRSQAAAQLRQARIRLDAANAAVGKMIRRDYPTGEARLRIYDEQRAAQRAEKAALEALGRFGGSTNGDASDTP